ncbi:MAG TPA: hypothetical protein VGD31_04330 [Sphingobacteriaceae bacterium]
MSFAIFETVEIHLNYNFKVESALMRLRHNFRDKGKAEQKFPNPESSNSSIQERNALREVCV